LAAASAVRKVALKLDRATLNTSANESALVMLYPRVMVAAGSLALTAGGLRAWMRVSFHCVISPAQMRPSVSLSSICPSPAPPHEGQHRRPTAVGRVIAERAANKVGVGGGVQAVDVVGHHHGLPEQGELEQRAKYCGKVPRDASVGAHEILFHIAKMKRINQNRDFPFRAGSII
jgi:hypothetical protein